MKKYFKSVALSIVLIAVLSAFTSTTAVVETENINISSVEDLDNSSEFSFALFSDNQGASPYDNIHMTRMNSWMRKSNVEFVIGVGDHIMQQDDRNFLSYILRDAWWYKNFYPTIADAENAYFGKSQADKYSGGALLKLLHFKTRKDIELRDNDAEYYAVKEVKGYKIHIISLHFPDQPANDSAFSEDSKKFMMNKLNSIVKTDKDIIIINAHSRYGFWIDNLNPKQRETVMNKADMLLSGTTHYFEKYLLDAKYNNKKTPLIINCGSPTQAHFGSHNGYVQVNFLAKEKTLVTQYVNLDNATRELSTPKETFVKHLNGKVKRGIFTTPRIS